MNEVRYQIVVDNLSTWKPTKTNKVFTVSNVLDITDQYAQSEPVAGFELAYEIYVRLRKEGKIPKVKLDERNEDT